MEKAPIREFVRADHEALLRVWIQTVYERERATAPRLVTEMTQWIEQRRLPIEPVARNSLERFVEKRNKSGFYRFEMKWLWQFLWDRYPRWCPRELLTPKPESAAVNPAERRKGITIAGTWEVTFPESKHPRDITIDIEQKGETLTGTSTHVKNDPALSGDEVRIYDLEGRLHSPFVLLNGIAQDGSVLAVNTWLLQVVLDGRTMKGYVSAYNTDKENAGIFSLQCKCRRI
jgi:hypothetical protein